jgi:hypothetical protein
MVDEQTCEVGWTQMPTAVEPCSNVWLQIFGKYETLAK